MKHKRLNRDGWGFSYYPYYQMRIDDELFRGTACLIKMTDGEENYWETPKAGRIQVTGAGMSWLELVPDDTNRVITIMYFPDGKHDAERHNYPIPADKSDIDLIVVVNSPMPDDVKRKFMDMVVALNAEAPTKGIEMSIVTKTVCNPFVYPTPFELHFSAMHIGWYKDNPEDYVKKMNGADADLAAHFTIIKKRGKCLCGERIDDVFGEVPKADYMDSIWNDIAEAEDDIITTCEKTPSDEIGCGMNRTSFSFCISPS